jgi:hypothetical protein
MVENIEKIAAGLGAKIVTKVPRSETTRQRLARLAQQSSTNGRKVSPMQIAAQLLEDALSGIPER